MPRILFALLLLSLGRASAQDNNRWLGFDLGVTPLYVYFEPQETDNWSGPKPSYATMAVATLNFGRKDEVGLGGGAFVWGEQVLFPVYMQIRLPFSVFYRDTAKVNSFVRRLSIGARIGTMLGQVETTAGSLTPRMWNDAWILYRLDRSPHSSLHVGVELSMFYWRGPYQVRTGDTWEDRRPQISTVGPVVQFRF